MSDQLSILVVTARPDHRRSTDTLALLVDHLRRRGTRVEVWFLRADPAAGDPAPWPGSRVVDDLRTWWPTTLLVGRLGGRVAGLARGARLRSWLRRLDPDLVLLDDGLGERVLDGWRRPVVRAVRTNPLPPADLALEPPPLTAAAVVIGGPGGDADHDGSGRLPLPELRDRSAAVPLADPAARARVRAGLGVPTGVPLVVGWGEDAWLDGTDLFVRTLWALGARHGVEAHGLWLGLSSDHHEADRLRAEADRCGLAGRFHLHPLGDGRARLAGDAVLLPTRVPGDPEPVLDAVCTGLVVVTTDGDAPPGDLPDGVTPVAPLDVEAAATAVRDALAVDRAARFERTRLLDAEQWLAHARFADRLARLAGR